MIRDGVRRARDLARAGRGRGVRRLGLLVLVVGAAGLAVHVAGWDDPHVVRRAAEQAGPGGALLFALAYAALTLTPLPKNALSITAGLAFGFGTGVAVVWFGAVAGAMAGFGLARWSGRGRDHLGGGRLERLNALLERRGLAGAVLVRLVPVLPFTAVNYGSGFTSLRVRHYALGTAVGIVPGSVVFVGVGAGATGMSGSTVSVVALAGLLVLVAATGLRRRRRR